MPMTRAEQQQATMRRLSDFNRDIPKIPKVKNPARRDKCKLDLLAFITTYFPEFKEWGEPHLIAIQKMQEAVLLGNLFSLAMSRGAAKSTLARFCAIWAIIYGHRKYILLVQAKFKLAKQELSNLKRMMESSKKLIEDFPEIMVPVQKLEGQFQRSRSQTCRGVLTEIEWGQRIKLPITKESKKAGNAESIIETLGLSESIRGKNLVTLDGRILRPDFFIADDCQKKEAALSDEQSDKMESIVQEDLMGCAGFGIKITGFYLCTIIRPGDLASRFLDHTTHPEWRGEKTGFFKSWPTNWDLWREWIRLKGIGDDDADAFYKSHREKMLEGAEVTWPTRHGENEDAVLHGMRIFVRVGEKGFASEYQNEPLEETQRAYDLNQDIVLSRISDVERGMMPQNSHYVVVGADVMQDHIRYVVTAFRSDMTSTVIDYGKFPEKGAVWDSTSPSGLTEGQAIATSVSKFLDLLESKKYMRDGKSVGIDLVAIDRGYMQSSVRDGCAKKRTFNVRLSLGRANNLWHLPTEFRKKGSNWYEKDIEGFPTIMHNADVWRKAVQQSFLLESGVSGGCSLFKSADHREFANHICAEQLMGEIKDKYNWHVKKGAQNHYLDCLVLSYIAASHCGCSFSGGERVRRPKKKLSLVSSSSSSTTPGWSTAFKMSR